MAVVAKTGVIHGTVKSLVTVQGSVVPRGSVTGRVMQPLMVSGDNDMYNGPYHVEPTFDEQTLATKNKTLYNNVTVNAIRVERLSNDHGTTVYIGVKGD